MRVYGAVLAGCLAMFLPGYRQGVEQVGSTQKQDILVATGQTVRTNGETLSFVGRPIDLLMSPDGQSLYVKDNRGIVVIDTATWKIRQELAMAGGTSLHGLAVTREGFRVYATNAASQLQEFATYPATPMPNFPNYPSGQIVAGRVVQLPKPKTGGEAYGCGIALTPDNSKAVVCLSRNNSLALVDRTAARMIREIPVGIAPWDAIVSGDGRTAYVSNWGGRRPKPGELTAPSAGSPLLVDARGIARSGSVSVVDIVEGREIAQIEVGLHPTALCLSAETLYVANANSDTISLINTATRKVVETISVHPDPKSPLGSSPNALALSPDGNTLYVANGGNNLLTVLDVRPGVPREKRIVGRIPVGWYPGAVQTDGKSLLVACVKGLGSRTEKKKQEVESGKPIQGGRGVYDFTGTVSRFPVPQPEELASLTKEALIADRTRQSLNAFAPARPNRKPLPVPEHAGEPSVFQHVVYIIKENRTYDQIFGDIKKGNGDPTLCEYGREITPNHHALAENFALLDNFYCNGVLSADGHSWATEANNTDHLERAFGGFTRSYTFGDDPLTYSASGFLWDPVLAKGLRFRNYGEMDYTNEKPDVDYNVIYKDWLEKTGKIKFAHNIGIVNLKRYSHPGYPGWNMDIPDVMRADVFLKDLRQWERKGTFPNLTILYLPNDHTTGLTPGTPTPRAYLADNDLALGRVVEGISKSPFWKKTCLFVVEDDPQAGLDHVDGHRSPCLVISPYTKRGAVVRQFYNQTSVIHTILRILGLPALNQRDSSSPLMSACFTTKPDFRPFTSLPNRIPLTETNPKAKALRGKALYWALQSQKLRFDRPDVIDDNLLNRILWFASKGDQGEYPAHLAGAHGRGLKQLGLHRDPEKEED